MYKGYCSKNDVLQYHSVHLEWNLKYITFNTANIVSERSSERSSSTLRHQREARERSEGVDEGRAGGDREVSFHFSNWQVFRCLFSRSAL